MRDVICVVDNGSTALAPPATYPWPERSATKLSTWFDDIVGWWQDAERADGKSFTHGQRLRDWSGDQSCDQLSAIVSILSTDPGSSRGVAVLMDPESDNIKDRAVSFPSFSLLHMWNPTGLSASPRTSSLHVYQGVTGLRPGVEHGSPGPATLDETRVEQDLEVP